MYYTENEKTCSIIPFPFRLLHAELPSHMGKSEISLDRLNKIETGLRLIKDEISGVQYREFFQLMEEVRDRVLSKCGLPLQIQTQDVRTKLTNGFHVDSKGNDALEKGLVLMLNGEYEMAYNTFVECLGNDSYDQSVIVNNMAISLVYQGKLTQAIQLLESRLDVCHNSKIIKNLCQLVALKCHDAPTKKRQILEQISGQLPDYFDVS